MSQLPRRALMLMLRLLLVALGAVLALAVLCGVVVLFGVWSVRRAWARITGRPVAPWVLRTDPMAVWRQASGLRRGNAGSAGTAGIRPSEDRPGVGTARVRDVTDVTPK